MADVPTYQLHCQLRGIDPPIWRDLLVPADLHLVSLHDVLQEAMDWTHGQRWRFEAGDRWFEELKRTSPTRFLSAPDPTTAPRDTVANVLKQVGDSILYKYDFDDGWEIDVRLDAVQASDPSQGCPLCLAGANAAPPADCGGVSGFLRFKEALADPQYPDHEESLEMVPEGWSPEVCNVSDINDYMPELNDLYQGDDDPTDTESPKEAAASAVVMELRIRDDLYDLLRSLVAEHPSTHPGPVAALDAAELQRKGRVIRTERRVWHHFQEVLDLGAEAKDFQRARRSRELSMLIAETR